MLTASFLANVKKRAIRGKVWFRALDNLERGILSLSAKVLDVIHSTSLSLELAKIIEKIEESLKSLFERRFANYGICRARELSEYAVKFGYSMASNWANEMQFARFITVMSLNKSLGWSI